MTLAADLETIRSQAGLDDCDVGALVRDEHQRYQFYLKAFALAPPPDDRVLLRTVLRDPDVAMGEAAAVEFVERQAQRRPSRESFASWAGSVADLTSGHDFLSRRIQEWDQFKHIMAGGRISEDFSEAWSGWLQRKLSEELMIPESLARIAELGRTKRIRSTARQRLRQTQG
jgi:hypothetical protein